MADYWGLDVADPLSSNLMIGCMFDQPNVEDQVLDFTPPITLTSIGSPTRPTINGKLAYQPATVTGVTDTALTFNGQWEAATGRSGIEDITTMFGFRIDQTTLPDRSGVFTIGEEGGINGMYFYGANGGNFSTCWRRYDICVTSTIVQDQLYRIITRSQIGTSNYALEQWLDNVSQGITAENYVSSDTLGEIGRVMNGVFGHSFVGALTDFFVWSDPKTDQEIADLFADPYRFLVPPGVAPAAPNPVIRFGANF